MKQFLKCNFQGGLPGFLMALMMAFMLAACGGGGGSPGIDPNKPTTPTDPTDVAVAKAASLSITTSAATMSTVTGSVDVAFLVRDANNNVVPGAKVTVAVSSGSLSRTNVDRITDKDGLIKETLTTPGDASEREITITGQVGKIAATPMKVKVVTARPTITLISSSGNLDSAGAAGTEITITALVKDSGNNVVPDVPVTLTADSGALTSGKRLTDAKGMVKETLSTGGNQTTRVITINASVPNAVATPLTIQVAGHKIVISANDSANLGKVSKLSAQLLDSTGRPTPNVPITFSASRATSVLRIAGTTIGSPATTDAQGQIQLDYTPGTGGDATLPDTITLSGLGVSAGKQITINAINFEITAYAGTTPIVQANTPLCVPFTAVVKSGTTNLTGSVTMSSSRGTVHSDAACSANAVLAGPISLNSGAATAYVKSTTPGMATLVSNFTGFDTNGTSPIVASSSSQLEFVSPLVGTAYIDLQADPAVVALGKATTLKAVVRDGTTQDNLVKDAVVVFSIVGDPSGGKLAQPTVVKTDASGSASVTYTGGASSTALGGVVLQAKIQDLSTPEATKQTKITVSGQALFISAGTGKTTNTPSESTYSVDYAVFVTDATGNAVNNATVVASVLPRDYYKGYYRFLAGGTVWRQTVTTPEGCVNEDKNKNGIMDPNEDTNRNGRLDPGIPITVTTSGTTDLTGQTKVTLTYPRDRATWTSIDMTIRARVSGTEATYVTYTILPGLSTDYDKEASPPPGATSPYGFSNSCNDVN